MHVPLDWLLGTYAGSKEEVTCDDSVDSVDSIDSVDNVVLQVSQIWGSKPSGEEANETAVHPASSKQDKVE